MEAGEATNNSRIFGESFVAMQFDKVLKQTLDQIECIGTIGMTSKKHTVKRLHGLADRCRWLRWIFFFLNLCHNSSGTTGKLIWHYWNSCVIRRAADRGSSQCLLDTPT